eukprot:TRINITY_DN21047_c0_g1_i2.p1 TRINITY_DN21047_c0_g1~~TRINITY_DN21047_c0_g1_i2.p1  ORF type:complete len:167 (+),score=13.71 TRINITY_DN21047_c0_g1_i2:88-588(+)
MCIRDRLQLLCQRFQILQLYCNVSNNDWRKSNVFIIFEEYENVFKKIRGYGYYYMQLYYFYDGLGGYCLINGSKVSWTNYVVYDQYYRMFSYLLYRQQKVIMCIFYFNYGVISVSYTHLTLPTICSVQISVVAVSLKKKKINNTVGYSQQSDVQSYACIAQHHVYI